MASIKFKMTWYGLQFVAVKIAIDYCGRKKKVYSINENQRLK
jgi:hypothetical protein